MAGHAAQPGQENGHIEHQAQQLQLAPALPARTLEQRLAALEQRANDMDTSARTSTVRIVNLDSRVDWDHAHLEELSGRIMAVEGHFVTRMQALEERVAEMAERLQVLIDVVRAVGRVASEDI